MLYVKKVKIGNDVFIGANSYLSPGVTIEDKTFVSANSHLYPNSLIKSDLEETCELLK